MGTGIQRGIIILGMLFTASMGWAECSGGSCRAARPMQSNPQNFSQLGPSSQNQQRVVTKQVRGLLASFQRVCDQNGQQCSFTLNGNPLDIEDTGILTITDGQGTREADDETIALLFRFYSNNWTPKDNRISICNRFLAHYRPMIGQAVADGRLSRDFLGPQGGNGTGQFPPSNPQAAPTPTPESHISEDPQGPDQPSGTQSSHVDSGSDRDIAPSRNPGRRGGQAGGRERSGPREVAPPPNSSTPEERKTQPQEEASRTIEDTNIEDCNLVGSVKNGSGKVDTSRCVLGDVTFERRVHTKSDSSQKESYYLIDRKSEASEIKLGSLLEGTEKIKDISMGYRNIREESKSKTKVIEFLVTVENPVQRRNGTGQADTKILSVLLKVGDTPEETCISHVSVIKPYGNTLETRVGLEGMETAIKTILERERKKVHQQANRMLTTPTECLRDPAAAAKINPDFTDLPQKEVPRPSTPTNPSTDTQQESSDVQSQLKKITKLFPNPMPKYQGDNLFHVEPTRRGFQVCIPGGCFNGLSYDEAYDKVKNAVEQYNTYAPKTVYQTDNLQLIARIIKHNQKYGRKTFVRYSAKKCPPCQQQKKAFSDQAKVGADDERYYILEVEEPILIPLQEIEGITVGGNKRFPETITY